MPVFRYFLVMGCCLLGLIAAAGWIWPNTPLPGSAQTPVAYASAGSVSASSDPAKLNSANPNSDNLGSLADWRRSEDRLDRKKHDQAIVYPDVATLAPTADRLQWERQLRYLPEDHRYEARAEMPKATSKTIELPKVAEKKAPVHRRVARIEAYPRIAANVDRQSRPIVARNNSWDPFGLFD
ncbi:MAG: hypothetical protein JSS22_23820 [Proteobacteria bacterium]|nr:hypothetical protein [Pseudomonadota bacterium]